MWEEYLRSEKVRKASPDIALAKSLLEMSARLLMHASSTPMTDLSASPLFGNFYDALRQVCEAIAVKNGFKVYSHEAYTGYLKDVLREELIAQKFDRYRRLRNGMEYYGKPIDLAETNAAAREIPRIIQELRTRHLKL